MDKQEREGTLMARTRPSWATRGPGLARGLVKRGIRRRRLAGGLRGALHASLQRLNLLLELVDTLLQALYMRLNGRRSQHPFCRRKGQSPEAHIGFGWRCWWQHPQGSAMRGCADVLIRNLISEVNVIMTSHAVKKPLWSRTNFIGSASMEVKCALPKRASVLELDRTCKPLFLKENEA
jgi:hypothetical protein